MRALKGRVLIALSLTALVLVISADASPTGSAGSVCGVSRCVPLPATLAHTISASLSQLPRRTQPKPAPNYFVHVTSSTAAIGWVPLRQAFLVVRISGASWLQVPTTVGAELARLVRSVNPIPAPDHWSIQKPLPPPPATALGRAEGSFCETENCTELNKMIARWLSAGHISSSHAVGAFYLYSTGCLNCHTYRGAGARNLGAPDLTHVGRRMSAEKIRKVIECPVCVSPQSPMPSFSNLPEKRLAALVAFLAASR